jgi:multidrug transporter EmrE-like cation transporter
MISPWIFAGLAVLLTGISQTLLKMGARKKFEKKVFMAAYFNPYTVTAYGLFLAVTLFSVNALKEIPLKVFYSFTALNFLVVMVFSHFVLKESVSKKQIFAISLIILGVVIFNI